MKINLPHLEKANLQVTIGKYQEDERDFIFFKQNDELSFFAIDKISFDNQRIQVVLINGNTVGSSRENDKNNRIQIDDRIIYDESISQQENVYNHLANSLLRLKVLSSEYANFYKISEIYQLILDEDLTESSALDIANQSQKLSKYFDNISVQTIRNDIKESYNKNIWTLENAVKKLGIKEGDVFEDKEYHQQRMILGFVKTTDKKDNWILSSKHIDLNRPATLYFSARENSPRIDNNDWLKFNSYSYLNSNNYTHKGNLAKTDIAFDIINTQAKIQQSIWVLDNYTPQLLDAYNKLNVYNEIKDFEYIIRNLSNKQQLKSIQYDGIAVEKVHKELSSATLISIVYDFKSFKEAYFKANKNQRGNAEIQKIFDNIEKNFNKLEDLNNAFNEKLLLKNDSDKMLNNLIKNYEESLEDTDNTTTNSNIKNNKPKKNR